MKKKLLTILLSIAVILTSTVTVFAEEQYALGGTTVTVANATSENILDDGSLVLVFNDTTNNGSIKLEGITTTADILLVGGGGAGGTVRSTAHTSHPGGGGGGAGELLIREKISLVLDTYTITVGAGGVADGVFNTKSIGQNGNESKITSTNINIVVKGGGGGGGESEGSSGGSGGGDSNENANGGSASKNNDDGLVNNGGASLKRYAGGGGGSAEVGENAREDRGGNGGVGTVSSITGEEKYYAAGGGGGTTYSGKSGGAGGSGIGGNGGKYNDNDDAAPTKGIDGTGSGGGGGGRYKPGAAGGSGTVIVRIYPSESSTKTTANVLETVEGGFPTSSELGWVNENGRKAYINGNILTVSFNVPLETILQKEENNYKYVNDSGQNCTFVMTSGKLTSIIVSGALVPGYNGEFFPPAPVAQIGDTGYLTLQDAFNAVQNNETIVLLDDISVDSTFNNLDGKAFAIDLNNFKIVTSAVTGFDINSANLTVKNGTVINNNTSGLSGSTMETRTKAFFLEKEGQGSLTLDGVKIESTGYSVNVNNNNNSNGAKNKTVVIKDSDLSSAKWCAVYANSVDGSNELTINNSSIHSSWTNTSMAALQICVKTTIEKTTVTNDYGAAVGCFENTDLLVKGTENSFVGASGAISTNGSKDLVQITIEGGEFKTTGTTKEAGIAFYHPDGSPLTIKGGTFEGATALYVKGGTIDIQDGSFTGTGNYETAQKVKSGAYTTGDAVVI